MADKNQTPSSEPEEDEEESEPSEKKPAAGSSKEKSAKDLPSGAAASTEKSARLKQVAKAAAAAREEDEEDDESDDDSDDDDDDDDSDDDSDDDEGADAGERDESTRGVAKALGIDEDEDEAEAGEEGREEAAAPNRAARRREEAQKRRAARDLKKKGGIAKVDDDEDIVVRAQDPDKKLPKDKNARAKELLKRRQEASTTRVQLGATELVQDSLARAGSATTKALRKNLGLILTVLGIASAGAIGYFVWTSHTEGLIASASDELMVGVQADRAPTQKEDKRTEEEKKLDPTPFFTSNDVRTDTALAAYKKVIDEHPNTGPAIMAKLGQAGIFLEKAQYDQAIEAFGQVVSSKLASAEVDVKARATEGIGLAREGKGDTDGATASFKELEAIKGYEDLAKYHQGRMLLKKGKVDEAKDMLVELRKKIEVPTLEGPQEQFLTEATNEILASIDPTLAHRQTALNGLRGDSMTGDEQADAQKRAIEALKRQIQKQQKDHPGSPIQMPNMPGMPGEDPE